MDGSRIQCERQDVFFLALCGRGRKNTAIIILTQGRLGSAGEFSHIAGKHSEQVFHSLATEEETGGRLAGPTFNLQVEVMRSRSYIYDGDSPRPGCNQRDKGVCVQEVVLISLWSVVSLHNQRRMAHQHIRGLIME